MRATFSFQSRFVVPEVHRKAFERRGKEALPRHYRELHVSCKSIRVSRSS